MHSIYACIISITIQRDGNSAEVKIERSIDACALVTHKKAISYDLGNAWVGLRNLIDFVAACTNAVAQALRHHAHTPERFFRTTTVLVQGTFDRDGWFRCRGTWKVSP